MELFQQYIEPVTVWLQTHPNTALFLTFFIAFTESLAIVGSIIPGSVTMTAVGILAGSGILRIDLTLIMASLGAIVGDSVSYLLGLHYSHAIANMWPFKRYPYILAYGQSHFEKHGGKSVLIGRFVGPLRSIIPVIAGMMKMSRPKFFAVNVLSGIMWAFLYVTPGILIGEASHELSPERATRLLILVLALLIGIWLLSVGLKALYLRTRTWLNKRLNHTWAQLLHTPYLKSLFHTLTPYKETHHTQTFLLLLFVLASLSFLFFFPTLNPNHYSPLPFNHTARLLLQSIRTHSFDVFFAGVRQFLSPLPVLTLCFYLALEPLSRRAIQTALLWLLTFISSFFILEHYQAYLQQSPLIDTIDIGFPLPDIHGFTLVGLSTLSTTLFLAHHTRKLGFINVRMVLKLCFILALLLGSFSFVYFGDLWLSDWLAALLAGLMLSAIYWMIYRKLHPEPTKPQLSHTLLGTSLCIISFALACSTQFHRTLERHQVIFTQHILSENFWWQQHKPILPLYSTNRVGKVKSVFNVQYLGSLPELRRRLLQLGWEEQPTSFVHHVIKQFKTDARIENPLNASLYLNKKPTLSMTYTPPRSRLKVRLQLWRSNYFISSFSEPIWLGHVQLINPAFKRPLYTQDPALFTLNAMIQGLKTRFLTVPPAPQGQAHPFIEAHYILLIRQDN